MFTAPTAVTFYSFDPECEPALIELLRESGYRRRFGEPFTELWLREPYGRRADIVVHELLRVLRGIDPTATFEITQNPTSQLHGDRVVVDPELGEFHSGVDDQDTALLRVHDLVRNVEFARRQVTDGADPLRVLAGLDHVVGGPWQRRLRHLELTHPGNRPTTWPAAGPVPALARPSEEPR